MARRSRSLSLPGRPSRFPLMEKNIALSKRKQVHWSTDLEEVIYFAPDSAIMRRDGSALRTFDRRVRMLRARSSSTLNKRLPLKASQTLARSINDANSMLIRTGVNILTHQFDRLKNRSDSLDMFDEQSNSRWKELLALYQKRMRDQLDEQEEEWVLEPRQEKRISARIECDVPFTTIGCFQDSTKRLLPHYILNEMDPSISNYGGECWAGHKSTNNYMSLGEADPDMCLGDDYKNCGKFDRFCAGKLWANMVYEIDDPTCSLEYEKVGCFQDRHRSQRPLPSYLMNDRDVFHHTFSGKLIDWRNWDVYVPDLACRCAKKAHEKGMTFFGLQFYGECWSGANSQNTFAMDGPHQACTDQCYQPCHPYSKFCVGQNFVNFVYKIKSRECEIGIQPIGCFNEEKNNRAFGEEIYNEVDPSSPVFAGHLISTKNWAKDFPLLLCKCARSAKAKGYDYFGVNNFGSCWSDEVAAGRYNLHGESSQCFEGDVTAAGSNKTQKLCPPGSMLCSGGAVTNYVYKMTDPIPVI
ncbi:hypothetical protein OS493_025159 [Desmophyllum pertusum]|uniref:WSC domain-containing protein n=1 Tax=Desmophyllum pertusum TaxID=174260 RepID=A0A9X0A098_9CNID|nr:hypothetical protein OS493_025159 [Desmophyllum pertusum]